MSVGIRVSVFGVKDALKELNKVNPKLRRQYTKRYKAILKPVVDSAKKQFPDDPPLSRFGKPYKHLGAWDGGLVEKGVTVRINTRKARKRNIEQGAVYETISTFLIQQKTGWGSLFDMAGRKNPDSQLAKNLVKEGYGKASRAMWPAYENDATRVDAAVLDLVRDVMRDVNRNMVIDGN